MHLLETYAVSCGAQIGKCFIKEESMPLPEKKYITFHGFNPKGSSRQYEHWQIVIDTLLQHKEFDYDIVQVGGLIDHRFNGINTEYLGATSYNNLAYLIKHSELHLGFDSLPVHLASHYNKKIVAIYCHYSSISGPYFSSHKDIRILQPDFSQIKPTYGYNDPNNLIQKIDPLEISEAVLSLLRDK
jgi:ADP-heptose:LPS heptosyltransferase